MIIPNLLGFWRLPSLWYYRKDLRQLDLLLNPFYIICDLPWLVFMAITIVFAPHRVVFTYLFGLAAKNPTMMLYPRPESDGGGVAIGRMRYDLIWCTLINGIEDFLMIPV